MGLVWLEGFETLATTTGAVDDTVNNLLKSKYTYWNEATSCFLSTGYESEGLCLELNYNSSCHLKKAFVLDDEWVIGVAWRSYGAFTTLHEDVIQIFNGGVSQLRLEIDDQGTLNLIQNVTGLWFGTTVLSIDTWYYIELKCKINSGTSGSWEVWLDGVSQGSGTGVKTGTYDAANIVQFGPSDGGFDDIYIKSGDAADTPIGPCKVRAAFPTSDGTVTDWTTSSGSTHYDLVDEKPPGTTDYTYTNVTNEEERFGITIPGSDTVHGAMLCAVTNMNLPGVNTMRVLVDSNSTLSTYDQAIGTEDWYTTTMIVEVDPDTSAAWTPTTMNAAEWGVKML
jgi:hypothetical protein